MIRGIIFDCFGVLYGGSYEALQQLCLPNQLQDLRDFNHQADYGFITSAEYVRGVAELVGRTDQEIADILHQKHIRNQELVAYAAGLRGEYKTALLSNVSDGMIERLFTADELATFFDVVVLSNKEHVVKPNPAIFELAADRLGFATGECIMIDDLMDNCEGAEAAGMDSILHTSNERTVELLSKKLRNNS